MSLLALPHELFQPIIEDVVAGTKLQKATGMRGVCRRFDTEVQRAIYALPIFSSARFKDTPARAICDLPRYMSAPMVTGLIMAKMKSNGSGDRLLCENMKNVVDFLLEKDFIKENERDKFQQALAAQAATNLSLLQVVIRLIQPPGLETRLTTLNDAFSAAILLDRAPVIQPLLDMGADAIVKSDIFGMPLYMLANRGSMDTVRVILDHEAVPRYQHSTGLVRHKMRRVLSQAAAAHGRADIIEHLLKPEYCTGLPGRGYGGAIKIAVENDYDDIAVLLLQHRTPYPPDGNPKRKKGESVESRFWYHLAATCVNHSSERVLELVLHDESEKQWGWLDSPIDVARKNGDMKLVEMMEGYLRETCAV